MIAAKATGLHQQIHQQIQFTEVGLKHLHIVEMRFSLSPDVSEFRLPV